MDRMGGSVMRLQQPSGNIDPRPAAIILGSLITGRGNEPKAIGIIGDGPLQGASPHGR